MYVGLNQGHPCLNFSLEGLLIQAVTNITR
jgi:hypothetical protein